MIRIIDNKKVDLTNDEYTMYENLCKANDRPAFKGASLFEDHFEVNGDGVIVFVKPPYKKYSSMEVYCFLISLMVNQHLRISYKMIGTLVKEAEAKFNEVLNEFKDNIKEIDNLKQEVETLKKKRIKTVKGK